MMAGIALDIPAATRSRAVALIAIAVAVKATAGLALPFMVWVWARQLRDGRGLSPLRAFAAATAASIAIFVAVFAVLSLAGRGRPGLADRAGGFGEDHQLADGAHRRRRISSTRSAGCSCR